LRTIKQELLDLNSISSRDTNDWSTSLAASTRFGNNDLLSDTSLAASTRIGQIVLLSNFSIPSTITVGAALLFEAEN
jgi:hypothetical protein